MFINYYIIIIIVIIIIIIIIIINIFINITIIILIIIIIFIIIGNTIVCIFIIVCFMFLFLIFKIFNKCFYTITRTIYNNPIFINIIISKIEFAFKNISILFYLDQHNSKIQVYVYFLKHQFFN